MSERDVLQRILNKVDVKIGGHRPHDIMVHDERAYAVVSSGGTLAIGESFMDAWWDVADLAELTARVYRLKTVQHELISYDLLPLLMRGFFFNLQSRARAFMVGQEHYDLGNNLYERMLDSRMVYTSAVWNGVKNLEEAQKQKLDLICQKLKLKSRDRILDIGCGWGSLMKFAAEHYGVSCVGLSVSEEQTKWGRTSCQGLPVEFVLTDYRDYEDERGFDHVVSIEMIEAVGPKNFRTYFKKAHELLKPGGTFVLQAIGSLDPSPAGDRWIDKYIFPNGILPSLPQLERATRNLFIWEHLENIGPDYDPTLMAWWRNFDATYPELKAKNPKYNERFYRMWKFYLQGCAGLFRSREIQDWQIIFSKR